jgi:transposase-like protein
MGDTGAMINLQSLMDDAKCFATVRDRRWPDGVRCPDGDSPEITKQGRDDTQPERQRYLCQSCERRFDDLTHTIFAGHHQPLRVWILCSYLMGLNLSNAQIAQELDLNKDDAHHMTTQLRQGIVTQTRSPTLSGEVEGDEVSLVAGHKGQPDEVAKRGALGDDGDSREPEGEVPLPPRNRRSSA